MNYIRYSKFYKFYYFFLILQKKKKKKFSHKKATIWNLVLSATKCKWPDVNWSDKKKVIINSLCCGLFLFFVFVFVFFFLWDGIIREIACLHQWFSQSQSQWSVKISTDFYPLRIRCNLFSNFAVCCDVFTDREFRQIFYKKLGFIG